MTQSVEIGGGVQIDLTSWSKEEAEVFRKDFPRLVAMYTQHSVDREQRHLVSDLLIKHIADFALVGQIAKDKLLPSSGVFGGMNATTGYGMQLIRPDYLFLAAQGRTYDRTVAGVKDNWYGWAHNGMIGAVYGAAPLYLRKEVCLGIVGFHELGAVPGVEEMKWEINNKPLPVWNMLAQMRAADIPLFELPQIMVLEPAVQYRSEYKQGFANGNIGLMAVGIAFARSSYMLEETPAQPAIVAP
jgi:hypothetical protein